MRLDPPVFVSVSVMDLLKPTCTVPNPRLVELRLNTPGVTPVPDSATFTAAPLFTTAILPVADPDTVGLNLTLNAVL